MTNTPDCFNQRPAGVVQQFIPNREGYLADVDAKDPNCGLLAWEAAYLFCSKDDAIKALKLEVLGYGFEFRRREDPDEEAERSSSELGFNISYGHIHRSLVSDLVRGNLLAAGFSQGSSNANQREFIRPERWAGLNLQIFRSEATANGVTITDLLVFPRTAPKAHQFLSGSEDRSVPRSTSRRAAPRLSAAALKRWFKGHLVPACVEMQVRLNVPLAVELCKEIYSPGVTTNMGKKLLAQTPAIKNSRGRPKGSAALPTDEQLVNLKRRLRDGLTSSDGLDGLDGLDSKNR